MGATKIMVIRHAEKPGSYNQKHYFGVDMLGKTAGDSGEKHLVTLGWERAGALVTLFAPPWGPKAPTLATPHFLFASDPTAKDGDDPSDEGPSQRPYETMTALAAKLGLAIDISHGKNHYAKMDGDFSAGVRRCGADSLAASGHRAESEDGRRDQPGNSDANRNRQSVQCPNSLADRSGWWCSLCDRPSGHGPISGFTLFPQQLLAADLSNI
jgi:hypothetical protein